MSGPQNILLLKYTRESRTYLFCPKLFLKISLENLTRIVELTNRYQDKKLEEDVQLGGAGSREGKNMGEDGDTTGKPVEAVEMMSNFLFQLKFIFV